MDNKSWEAQVPQASPGQGQRHPTPSFKAHNLATARMNQTSVSGNNAAQMDDQVAYETPLEYDIARQDSLFGESNPSPSNHSPSDPSNRTYLDSLLDFDVDLSALAGPSFAANSGNQSSGLLNNNVQDPIPKTAMSEDKIGNRFLQYGYSADPDLSFEMSNKEPESFDNMLFTSDRTPSPNNFYQSIREENWQQATSDFYQPPLASQQDFITTGLPQDNGMHNALSSNVVTQVAQGSVQGGDLGASQPASRIVGRAKRGKKSTQAVQSKEPPIYPNHMQSYQDIRSDEEKLNHVIQHTRELQHLSSERAKQFAHTLFQAFVNTTDVIDKPALNKDKSYIAIRIDDGYYPAREIEHVCWKVVKRCHAAQYGIHNCPPYLASKYEGTSIHPTLDDRVAATAELLRSSKAICKQLLDASKVDVVADAPNEAFSLIKSNKITNQKRDVQNKAGRAFISTLKENNQTDALERLGFNPKLDEGQQKVFDQMVNPDGQEEGSADIKPGQESLATIEPNRTRSRQGSSANTAAFQARGTRRCRGQMHGMQSVPSSGADNEEPLEVIGYLDTTTGYFYYTEDAYGDETADGVDDFMGPI